MILLDVIFWDVILLDVILLDVVLRVFDRRDVPVLIAERSTTIVYHSELCAYSRANAENLRLISFQCVASGPAKHATFILAPERTRYPRRDAGV